MSSKDIKKDEIDLVWKVTPFVGPFTANMALATPRLWGIDQLYELQQEFTATVQWPLSLEQQIVHDYRLVPIRRKTRSRKFLAAYAPQPSLMLTLSIAVGWLWVSGRDDGSRLERWLLLHEFERPLLKPLTVVPVDTLPNGHAPTSGLDFAAQMKLIFDARKANPPSGGDFTRYVRGASSAQVYSGMHNSLAGLEWLPDVFPAGRPQPPTPAGNGTWDGRPWVPGPQIDDGTVGIFRNGQLAGVTLEKPLANSGTSSVLLGSNYSPPTEDEPIVFGNLYSTTSSELLALSDDLGSNQRRWRLELASNTFYSDAFPNPA